MRAILSFVRASLVGLASFAAFTAALCIALSIAIAGPPTADELSSVRHVFAEVSRAIDGGVRELCRSPDLAEMCGQAEEVQVAEAEPAPVIDAAPAGRVPDVAPVAEDFPAGAAEPNLLGGDETPAAAPRPRAERATPPRVERRTSTRDSRRPAPQARASRRPPPPPIRHAAQDRAETLPAGSSESLAEIRAARAAELRHPDPAQEEQPAYEPRERDVYEDDPYADDYYEPDDYEEDEYHRDDEADVW